MPEPAPARWAADHANYPSVVARLRMLWAVATDATQRYHLELIMEDVRTDAGDKVVATVDMAVDDICGLLDDVRSQLRDLRRAVEKKPAP